MSTGMPRPLSSTVTDAVDVERDRDVVAEAGQRLVDRVVDDLEDQVVQAALGGVADVHAGALADRLETLEDLDLARRRSRWTAVFVLIFRYSLTRHPPVSPQPLWKNRACLGSDSSRACRCGKGLYVIIYSQQFQILTICFGAEFSA